MVWEPGNFSLDWEVRRADGAWENTQSSTRRGQFMEVHEPLAVACSVELWVMAVMGLRVSSSGVCGTTE